MCSSSPQLLSVQRDGKICTMCLYQKQHPMIELHAWGFWKLPQPPAMWCDHHYAKLQLTPPSQTCVSAYQGDITSSTQTSLIETLNTVTKLYQVSQSQPLISPVITHGVATPFNHPGCINSNTSACAKKGYGPLGQNCRGMPINCVFYYKPLFCGPSSHYQSSITSANPPTLPHHRKSEFDAALIVILEAFQAARVGSVSTLEMSTLHHDWQHIDDIDVPLHVTVY